MRPGRPRCLRRIESEPVVSYFKPRGVPMSDLDVVLLSLEELEAVRLVDLKGLNQEEAAQRIGISRRALWEDLQNSRRKIVEALVTGKAIEIKGGNYTVKKPRRCTCNGCQADWEIPFAARKPDQCPKCGGSDLHSHPEEQGGGEPERCGKGRCRHGNESKTEGEGA